MEIYFRNGVNAMYNSFLTKAKAKNRIKTVLEPTTTVHTDKVMIVDSRRLNTIGVSVNQIHTYTVTTNEVKKAYRSSGISADRQELQTNLLGSKMKSNKGFSESFTHDFQGVINLDRWNNTTKKAVRRNALMLKNARVSKVQIEIKDGSTTYKAIWHPNEIFGRVNNLMLKTKHL